MIYITTLHGGKNSTSTARHVQLVTELVPAFLIN